jgi:triphosphoribosyl-dephospho-CoA synthase
MTSSTGCWRKPRRAAVRDLAEGFLLACELDVAVRKPGNVSRLSPGHGMDAPMFIRSAAAAAPALFDRGASVGERIARAVSATWAAVGCNTNLGIVLLAAPLAAAAQALPAEGRGPLPLPALRESLAAVLRGLDMADARHAYAAILQANPAGLGRVAEQDVADAPALGLTQAMALAAERDRIAAQYANGFAGVFGLGVPAVLAAPSPQVATLRAFLAFTAAWPDSHIARKHGAAVAQTVMNEARAWMQAAARDEPDGVDDPALAAWDESLKVRGLNPGTSADLTVASLMVARWTQT